MKTDLSAEKAIESAKTIYQVQAETTNHVVKHILLLTDKQRHLAELFGFG